VTKNKELSPSVIKTALSESFKQITTGFYVDESDPQKDFWDARAESCLAYNKIHISFFSGVISLISQFGTGSKAAEVGCGYGVLLHCIRDLLKYDVTAYEFPAAIMKNTRGLEQSGITVLGWNIYDEDEVAPAESYDIIVCTEVVEHLMLNLPIVLEKLRITLKSGGKLFLTTPNLYSYSRIIKIFQGKNITEKYQDKPRYDNGVIVDPRIHPREYTIREVQEAFSNEKWKIEHLSTWGGKEPLLSREGLLQLLFRLIFPWSGYDRTYVVAQRI